MSYESAVKSLENLPEPNRTHLKTFVRHKSLRGLSKESIRSYISIGFNLINHFDGKDLKQITREDIEEYIMWMKENRAAGTVQTNVIVMRELFSDLIGKTAAEEMLSGISIRHPRISPVRDEELLNDEEIKKMILAARTERDRAFIAVLYASGCRSGEILGLKLKDISFTKYGASLHVNGKTGERDVDLFVGVPELKAWYNVHPRRDDPNSPLWITKNGGGVIHRDIYTILMRTAKRAGIPEGKRFHPHAFRHKRATDCAQFMTVADMKEMFGWTAGSDMPSVYVHSSRQRVRDKLMANAGIEVPEKKKTSALVGRQCKVCGCINSSTATICMMCGEPLTEELSRADNEYQEFLLEHAAELTEWKRQKDKIKHVEEEKK